MKEAITSTTIINIVLIFMAIVFAFIFGIIAYYKAFKVNKSILAIIEKYEGYNQLSIDEIDRSLTSTSYSVFVDGSTACPEKEGVESITSTTTQYKYCIYQFDNDTNNSSNRYYSYGIITYIKLDLPIVNYFIRIPLYSKSNRIYRFS